ncbi:MAG TPA: MFS transporter, partial [Polyangia bacterium]
MRREPLLTRPFLLAFAAYFLHSLSFNLFLHLPGFVRSIGADEVTIGLIYGATGLTAVLARPALGRAMDVYGRRGVFLAGGVLNAVICALYLTVHAPGSWLYTVRIIHGLAEAMLFTSLFAFAADIVPATRRIEGLAIFGISGMLPLSLGGLLGDLLLARWGFAQVFEAATLLAAVGLALTLPLADAPPAPGAEAAPPRGLLAAGRQRDLLPLWFIGTVFSTAVAAHFTFLKTYVMTVGFGSVGLFFTLYSLAAVGLRLVGASLPDRIGPKRALVPALAVLAAGLWLLATGRSAAAVAAAGVLCGLGHGYTFPILLGMVVSRARPAERGAALAIFTALYDLGSLIGSPVLGLVIR